MYTKGSIPTCSKTPPNPHTQRVSFCRHNVVVGTVSYEPLRESDVSLSTWDIGGVPVDQVGIGLVRTIVNGAGVLSLKECALHNCGHWVSGVNTNHKVTKISVTYGERKCNPIQWQCDYDMYKIEWMITQDQSPTLKVALITAFHSNNICHTISASKTKHLIILQVTYLVKWKYICLEFQEHHILKTIF